VLTRNDDQMGRGLRVDIDECKGKFVLIHRLRRYGPFNDLAKYAIHSVTSVHGDWH
jgi:hypothetical protein